MSKNELAPSNMVLENSSETSRGSEEQETKMEMSKIQNSDCRRTSSHLDTLSIDNTRRLIMIAEQCKVKLEQSNKGFLAKELDELIVQLRKEV